MKALIEQLAVDGGRSAQLFRGGRRHFDLYDPPAMERLGARDWIRFIPCVSEEPAGASAARHGTAIEVAIRYGVLADHDVHACGPPAHGRRHRRRPGGRRACPHGSLRALRLQGGPRG